MIWPLEVAIAANVGSTLFSIALAIKRGREYRKIYREIEENLTKSRALIERARDLDRVSRMQGATSVVGEGSGRWN